MNPLPTPPEWSNQSDLAPIGCKLGVGRGGRGGSMVSRRGDRHGLEPLLFFQQKTPSFAFSFTPYSTPSRLTSIHA